MWFPKKTPQCFKSSRNPCPPSSLPCPRPVDRCWGPHPSTVYPLPITPRLSSSRVWPGLTMLLWEPGRHHVLQLGATACCWPDWAQKAGVESGSSSMQQCPLCRAYTWRCPRPSWPKTLSEWIRGQFPRSPVTKFLCFSLGFSKELVRLFSPNFWNKSVRSPPLCPGHITFLSPRSESSGLVLPLLNASSVKGHRCLFLLFSGGGGSQWVLGDILAPSYDRKEQGINTTSKGTLTFL